MTMGGQFYFTIYTNIYRFRFWAPLINFDSENTKIELTKDIVIRKASEYEKREIDELIKKWPTITRGEFLLECVITKENPQSRPGEYIEDGRNSIEKTLTILRLYKDDIIGYNLIVQPLAEEEPYGITATTLKHYQLWVSPDVRLLPQKYTIIHEEIDNLKEFFTEFNVETFQHLSLAIEYFNKSYIEPYTPRDSFLDLMISLENLYLKDESLELAYKLRMRMAYILAKEFNKRREIFEDIKKAYSYRGRIVHGETPPGINWDFFLKIREYTRESLKIFIKKPALRNELDEIILKGDY